VKELPIVILRHEATLGTDLTYKVVVFPPPSVAVGVLLLASNFDTQIPVSSVSPKVKAG
jgi:hypothetical protein